MTGKKVAEGGAVAPVRTLLDGDKSENGEVHSLGGCARKVALKGCARVLRSARSNRICASS